jgi:hypothetical protein
MKLKILIGYVVAAVLGAMFALPALAQSPQAEAELQRWIAHDPRLQRDPGLMNNPTYLRDHPNFATWLREHPGAHQQVERMGAYDNDHRWHDTNWWHQNHPDWVSQNHPEWNNNHPEWGSSHPGGTGPGAYDEHHNWHDSNWWNANRADWVKQNHPEWAAHHEERVEHRQAAVHEYVEHHDHHDHDHH